MILDEFKFYHLDRGGPEFDSIYIVTSDKIFMLDAENNFMTIVDNVIEGNGNRNLYILKDAKEIELEIFMYQFKLHFKLLSLL